MFLTSPRSTIGLNYTIHETVKVQQSFKVVLSDGSLSACGICPEVTIKYLIYMYELLIHRKYPELSEKLNPM